MTVQQAQAALTEYVRQFLIPDLASQKDREAAVEALNIPSTLAMKSMHLGMFYGVAVTERFKRYEKRKERGWQGLVLGKASKGPGIVHANWMPKFELAMRCDPQRAEQALESHAGHSMFVGWLFEIHTSSDPWVHDGGSFLYQWARVERLPEACFLFCNNGLRSDGCFLHPDEYVYAARLLMGLPISLNLTDRVRSAGLHKRQQHTDLHMTLQPLAPQNPPQPGLPGEDQVCTPDPPPRNSSQPVQPALPQHCYLSPS